MLCHQRFHFEIIILIRGRRWHHGSILVASNIYGCYCAAGREDRLESAQNGVTAMIRLDSFETEKSSE